VIDCEQQSLLKGISKECRIKHRSWGVFQGIQVRAGHAHESQLKRRTEPQPGTKSAAQFAMRHSRRRSLLNVFGVLGEPSAVRQPFLSTNSAGELDGFRLALAPIAWTH